jgi:hypothetical protein
LKISERRRKTQSGQAILLVVLATSIFLLGAVGFAIDGSHLYAQRQMAQAAADAAAQAGVLSIFDGSSGVGIHSFSCPSTPSDSTPCFTCAASDARTPCYYAQTMNGFNEAADVVKVWFPTAAGVGVSSGALSGSDPVNLLKVTIERQVKTTLMQLLRPTLSTIGPSFGAIAASGTAAIVTVSSAVPIIVTHPILTDAFSMSGGPTITICGGPPRSIQVNSDAANAVHSNGNGTIDLTHAGPGAGVCGGTGGSFGAWGGPATAPFTLLTAGTGAYIQPASPILDPLCTTSANDCAGGVNPPAVPAVARPADPLANGTYGCPASPKKGCMLYYPGLYTSKINVKNQTAIFSPGIYYLNGSGVDFTDAANGELFMASGLTDSSTAVSVTLTAGVVNAAGVTSCCGTNQGWDGTVTNGGMLVYMTGPSSPSGNQTGLISVGANGNASLIGSPSCATPPCAASPVTSYKGILFFVDRSAAPQTHSMGGGGTMTVIGTFYAPELLSVMKASAAQYQTLSLQGTPGGTTNITGEIIVGALALGGNSGITMTLSGLPTPVRQVALVN